MIPTADHIPIVGIVGGVGSGKSALAGWLGRQLRAAVFDADAAGHTALRDDGVKQALRERFGEAIFDERGDVSRPQLAALVFGPEPAHAAARQDLEAVVHPVIRRRLLQEIDELQRQEEQDLIVLDAAVLLESGWRPVCDALVFLDVPADVRKARVRQTRGWTSADLERREASQLPLSQKRAAADVVIDNSGRLEAAGQALLEFLCDRFPRLAASRAALAGGGAAPCLQSLD